MINELTEQLQHVIDALAADLYHPLGEMILEGFKTKEELSLTEAERLPRTLSALEQAAKGGFAENRFSGRRQWSY